MAKLVQILRLLSTNDSWKTCNKPSWDSPDLLLSLNPTLSPSLYLIHSHSFSRPPSLSPDYIATITTPKAARTVHKIVVTIMNTHSLQCWEMYWVYYNLKLRGMVLTLHFNFLNQSGTSTINLKDHCCYSNKEEHTDQLPGQPTPFLWRSQQPLESLQLRVVIGRVTYAIMCAWESKIIDKEGNDWSRDIHVKAVPHT